MRNSLRLLILLLLFSTQAVQAHHSFAVHFVSDRIISVKGVVTDFRFSNPHGLVYFTVTDKAGDPQEWRAETNSPNILRRRGWSKDSIHNGDVITVEGYPTRDGTNYVRITRVLFEDGRELIGQSRVLLDPEEAD